MLSYQSWLPRKERANKIYDMICGYMSADVHKFFPEKTSLALLPLITIILKSHYVASSMCANKYQIIQAKVGV